MRKTIAFFTIMVAAGIVQADPPAVNKTAPSKLVGKYRRTAGDPESLTADKGSSCGAEASTFIQKMASSVTSVTVRSNSIQINTGKASAITFATQTNAMSNVVLDRDDRFTTALRVMVLESGALVLTYNKVERETADWCSDAWGVLIRR